MAKDKKTKGKWGSDDTEENGTPDETTPDNPPEGGEESGQGEPAVTPPAAGPRTVTVQGTGTLSIMADGKANTVERGNKIKVSPELLEALKAHGEQVEEEKTK